MDQTPFWKPKKAEIPDIESPLLFLAVLAATTSCTREQLATVYNMSDANAIDVHFETDDVTIENIPHGIIEAFIDVDMGQYDQVEELDVLLNDGVDEWNLNIAGAPTLELEGAYYCDTVLPYANQYLAIFEPDVCIQDDTYCGNIDCSP